MSAVSMLKNTHRRQNMQPSLDELDAFLAEKQDSRKYRRGVAVKMALKGYLYDVICDVLNVSPGSISQWKNAYEVHGRHYWKVFN
jgi:Homeodomain-like domain